jgi:hypothetical protein
MNLSALARKTRQLFILALTPLPLLGQSLDSNTEPILLALDYKTGNVVWKHQYPSGGFGNVFPGVLSTAGKLLFTGDPSGICWRSIPLRAASYGISGWAAW